MACSAASPQSPDSGWSTKTVGEDGQKRVQREPEAQNAPRKLRFDSEIKPDEIALQLMREGEEGMAVTGGR